MQGGSTKRFGRRIAAAVALASLVAAAPSGAKIYERDTFAYSGTRTFDDCGFVLQREFTVEGAFKLRETRSGEVFMAMNRFEYHSVVTNPETGAWFVDRGHGLFKETRATHVEGTIYEIHAVEAGQPAVIEDSSGRVVARDRGVIRWTVLFDTLGDGEPGGEFLEESVAISGPHPAFDEDFFCATAAELTGAG